MPKINVLGSQLIIAGALHVDDIAYTLSPLIAQASNPVSWIQRLGGVAANAACAAARADIPTQHIKLLAAIGDDPAGKSLKNAIQASGIEAKLIPFAKCNTGRYSAILNSDGELYIGLADVSLAERLSAEEIVAHSDLSSDCHLLVDANLSAVCLTELANVATQLSATLAAMSVSPLKSKRLLPIAQHVNLLFCNRLEALAMCPHLCAKVSLEALADALTESHFKQFLITDGSNPILIQSAGERYSLNVPALEQISSVNGAGDALAGATFAAWANGSTLVNAVQHHGFPQAMKILTGEQQPQRIGSAA